MTLAQIFWVLICVVFFNIFKCLNNYFQWYLFPNPSKLQQIKVYTGYMDRLDVLIFSLIVTIIIKFYCISMEKDSRFLIVHQDNCQYLQFLQSVPYEKAAHINSESILLTLSLSGFLQCEFQTSMC